MGNKTKRAQNTYRKTEHREEQRTQRGTHNKEGTTTHKKENKNTMRKTKHGGEIQNTKRKHIVKNNTNHKEEQQHTQRKRNMERATKHK